MQTLRRKVPQILLVLGLVLLVVPVNAMTVVSAATHNGVLTSVRHKHHLLAGCYDAGDISIGREALSELMKADGRAHCYANRAHRARLAWLLAACAVVILLRRRSREEQAPTSVMAVPIPS